MLRIIGYAVGTVARTAVNCGKEIAKGAYDGYKDAQCDPYVIKKKENIKKNIETIKNSKSDNNSFNF